MSRPVIAGVGCRRDCPADEVEAVLRLACGIAGRAAAAIAVPAFKAREPGVRLAADRLGLKMLVVDAAALADAQPRCPTASAAAVRAVGVGSVAEGCALAGAGAGGRLVLARVVHGRATCALAEPG